MEKNKQKNNHKAVKIKSAVYSFALDAKDIGMQVKEWTDNAIDRAGIVAEEVADTSRKINENLKQMRLDTDRKILRPVFAEDISNAEFNYPKLLNLCDEDEKHRNSIVCKDSIGFISTPNNVNLLNAYEKNIESYNINLEPIPTPGFYYANPCIPKTYIDVDGYFKYLQTEKARELLRVARSLGAKHVKIEISEAEMSEEDVKVKAAAKIGKGKADADVEKANKSKQTVSVFADEELEGHDEPVYPELIYFKNDKTVLDIIDTRLNQQSKLKKHTFRIESSNSTCMKEKEALSIDGALKSMKCSIKESMAVGAQKSNNSYFSFTIEF